MSVWHASHSLPGTDADWTLTDLHTEGAEGTGLVTLTCGVQDMSTGSLGVDPHRGRAERAIASIGAGTWQSHRPNEKVSWGMPTSEHSPRL